MRYRGFTDAERAAANAAMAEQRALGGLVGYDELSGRQQEAVVFPGRPPRGTWDTPAHRVQQARCWLYRVDENGTAKRAAFAAPAVAPGRESDGDG